MKAMHDGNGIALIKMTVKYEYCLKKKERMFINY